MPEGTLAAATLDAFTALAPADAGPADAVKFDGQDFRAEVLKLVAEGRVPPPGWWDAAAARVALPAADFRGRSLRSANLSGASLERADFTGADLAGGSLRDARMGGAVFDRALLEETDLAGASLRFATFREAVLEGASLRAADLWGAKLGGADADKADFRAAQLEEADFRDADAREADFRGAKLGLTDFRGADLRRADFRGSVPRAAKFDRADLRRANLEELDLTNASLANVWLSDARLDRTRFSRSQLGDMLGEEAAGEYELARRGYLSLERNFAATGDPEAASWAYRRRRRMEKLAARRQAAEAARAGRWGRAATLGLAYANHKLVELVCDYGESVPRVLAAQLAVLLGFIALYGVAGGVSREVPDGRAVTRAPIDLTRYALTAMVAPGNPPEGLHPTDEASEVATLTQSYLGVFLIGLLGFVAGNRIRR